MDNQPAVVIKRFNTDRTGIETVAYLENAYNVAYALPANDIYTCSFKLPADDHKAPDITPTSLIEIWDNGERVELFKVDTLLEESTADGHFLTVTGSHVRKFLQQRALFSIHEPTGETIEAVIKELLATPDEDGQPKQTDWVLSPHFTEVVGSLVIDYHFENSDIDAALWSIPENWKTPTQWVYDTTVYPWEINLVIADDQPASIIQHGKNLVSLSISQPIEAVANRFYGLGSGDGLNQTTLMTAEDLEVDPTGNTKNGHFYVEDAESIAKYGLIEDYYTDSSVGEPSLLLLGAKKALADYKEVRPVITVEAIDLYPQTKLEQDRFVTGKGCRIIDPETGMDAVYRILNVSKSDVTGQPYAVTLTLGDMPNTLATTIDRLYNRDNADKVNAQGATNIWSRPFADNVDKDHPIKVTFRLPDDLVYVNKLILDIQVEKFRAYETGQAAGGGSTSTSEVALTTKTSDVTISGSSGTTSATAPSTTSGAVTQSYTYTDEGNRIVTHSRWDYLIYDDETQRGIEPAFGDPSDEHRTIAPAYLLPADLYQATGSLPEDLTPIPVHLYQHEHPHTHSIPGHTHTIGAHTHTIPGHTHTIDKHSHTIDNHTHALQYGIYEPEITVTSLRVQFDGKDISTGSGLEYEIDILKAIRQKNYDKISRGKHTITITPITNDGGDGLCRITGELFIQCFVQSRGDYTV